jgi:hypothetical protein
MRNLQFQISQTKNEDGELPSTTDDNVKEQCDQIFFFEISQNNPFPTPKISSEVSEASHFLNDSRKQYL